MLYMCANVYGYTVEPLLVDSPSRGNLYNQDLYSRVTNRPRYLTSVIRKPLYSGHIVLSQTGHTNAISPL